jgi:hypothetical protein
MCVCGFGIETVKAICGAVPCDLSAWAIVATEQAAIRIARAETLTLEEYCWFIVSGSW